MRRLAIVLGAALVLSAGLGLGSITSSRASLLPCGILTPCTTTTTTPTTPPTTTTTPTSTTPPVVHASGRYTGKVGASGKISMLATSNGVQVTALNVSIVKAGKCSDGETYTDSNAITFTPSVRQYYGDPLAISRSGFTVFDETFKSKARRHTSYVQGFKTITVTTQFSASGAAGTVHDVFSGHGFSCDSGTLPYTAAR